MNKPNLEKMWRTWVRIGSKNRLTYKMVQDTIREKIYRISKLQKTGEIDWYYFILHLKTDDPDNLYFDVVFTTNRDDPIKFLPDYCIDIKKIAPMRKIQGIDTGILENEDITEAWRIIGEQSEFIISLIRAHAKNSEIHPRQIVQFMHFFMNPLMLGHKSVFSPDARTRISF